MKKSELKNIIKECVKEVIFEEGVLSGIITEVAQGLAQSPSSNSAPVRSSATTIKERSAARKEVLSAVSQNSYEEAKKRFANPGLFEGTKPLPSEGSGRGALSGVAPGDSGVDISNLPGFGSWGAVAQNLND